MNERTQTTNNYLPVVLSTGEYKVPLDVAKELGPHLTCNDGEYATIESRCISDIIAISGIEEIHPEQKRSPFLQMMLEAKHIKKLQAGLERMMRYVRGS